jgi:hypothetical protein
MRLSLHEKLQNPQNLQLHAFFFHRTLLFPDYLLRCYLISGIDFLCLGPTIPRNPKKRVSLAHTSGIASAAGPVHKLQVAFSLSGFACKKRKDELPVLVI